MLDLLGNIIKLPKQGDKVLRDGCVFVVSEIKEHLDRGIIATIILRGESGVVETGYYDYLLHQKA